MTSGSETSAKTRGMATTFSVGKVFSTITTVADEREYSTLRSPGQDVVWRVRARRQLYGSTNNGLPRVSYGPWSSIRSYSEPAGVADASAQLHTVSSDATSWGKEARQHKTMPVFVWPNDGFQFHRVYVSTDSDCVNIVHVGSIVGGTAYAPRTTGPLALSPEKWNDKDVHSFLVDGTEGEDTLRSDGEIARTSESPTKKDASASSTAATDEGPAPVDLWDSNWHSGRYYWTVVPVTRHLKTDQKDAASEPGKEAERTWVYQDAMLPQDACQADFYGAFKRKSAPARLGPSSHSVCHRPVSQRPASLGLR